MTAYKKSKKNESSIFAAVQCNSIFFVTIGVPMTGVTLPAFLSDGLGLW